MANEPSSEHLRIAGNAISTDVCAAISYYVMCSVAMKGCGSCSSPVWIDESQ